MQIEGKKNTITREQGYATGGTLLICALLVLILLFYHITMNKPELSENEIEIMMGDGADGMPAPEETTEPSSTPQTVTTPPAPSPVAQEPQMTAEDPTVAAARAEQIRKRKEEERQQQLERQRRLAERRAEQQRIAEEQRAAAERQAKADKAAALASGAFGGGGTNAQGAGPGGGGSGRTPGNPIGKGSGTVGGNSWSLAGRDIAKFSVPPYVGTQEGQVVVQITVNSDGTVIGTDIKLNGTTITDAATRDACKAAARKVKFTPANRPGNAIGTITYHFKQK